MSKKRKEIKTEEVKEFAKEFYLTPDDVDSTNHKYSLQNICDKILQQFDKEYTRQTLSNWSKKEGWQDLWEMGQRAGLDKIKQEKKEQETKEEYYRNKSSQKRVDRYKTNLALYTKSSYLANSLLDKCINVIKNGKQLNHKDISQLTSLGGNITRFNDALAKDDKESSGSDTIEILQRLMKSPDDLLNDPEIIKAISELEDDDVDK